MEPARLLVDARETASGCLERDDVLREHATWKRSAGRCPDPAVRAVRARPGRCPTRPAWTGYARSPSRQSSSTTSTPAWLSGGFLGVDIFFVLSGFLITSILLTEFGNRGRIDIKGFYLRRARRLLPALYAMLVGVVLLTAVTTSEELHRLRGDVLAALGYCTNWTQIFWNRSYFEQLDRPSLLQHLWSLAVEEQFYLLWPLLLVVYLVSRRRWMTFAVTVALIAASTLWMALLYQSGEDPKRAYYGTDTHIAPMLVGAALAIVLVLRRETRPPGRVLLLADLGGRRGVRRAGRACVGDHVGDLPRPGALSRRLPAALARGARGRPRGGESRDVHRALLRPDAAGLDRAALLRDLSVALADPDADPAGRGRVAALVRCSCRSRSGRPCCSPTCPTATSSGPIRKHRPARVPPRHAAPRRPIGPAAPNPAERVDRDDRRGLGRPARDRVGVERRHRGRQVRRPDHRAHPRSDDVRPGARRQPVARTASSRTASPVAPPPPPPFARPVRVSFFGDSQGMTLLINKPNGLDGQLTTSDSTVEGCGVLLGTIESKVGFSRNLDADCGSWPEQWRDNAAQNKPQIAVVELGAWDVFDDTVDGTKLGFGTQAWDAYYREQLAKGIAILTDAGAQVALMGVPCYRPIAAGGLPLLPERGYDDRTRHVTSLLRDAVAKDPQRVFFVHPPAQFCKEPIASDVNYRWDGTHFYIPGAALTFQVITPQLLAIPQPPKR